MDWNYLYALLAFAIGGLAGFQGVYERYGKDSLNASETFPGFLYLFSRAGLPSVLFLLFYGLGLIRNNLLLTALAFGAGVEAFLRTKFYIKQEQKGPGNIEELLKGPLDLLRFYQNLFLDWAATGLAQRRKIFIKRHVQASESLDVLYQRVKNNLIGWPDEQVKATLDTEVDKLKIEFAAMGLASTDERVQTYKYKLVYLIYNKVGPSGCKTLIST